MIVQSYLLEELGRSSVGQHSTGKTKGRVVVLVGKSELHRGHKRQLSVSNLQLGDGEVCRQLQAALETLRRVSGELATLKFNAHGKDVFPSSGDDRLGLLCLRLRGDSVHKDSVEDTFENDHTIFELVGPHGGISFLEVHAGNSLKVPGNDGQNLANVGLLSGSADIVDQRWQASAGGKVGLGGLEDLEESTLQRSELHSTDLSVE